MTVKQKKELKRKVEIVLVCIAIQLTWLVPLGIKVHLDNTKVADNTQIEIVTEEKYEPKVEISTEMVVGMGSKDGSEAEFEEKDNKETEVTETESEIVIETEVETETTTETEFEFVSISFIPIEIQKLCFEIGEEYHIAPELLIAIIERESGGKENAKNKKTGCMGLMQLHPKYANHYLKLAGGTDPFDAEDNIRAGCEILIEKFEQYYDLPLVLMKYHGESNATSKYKKGKYSKYCIGIMNRMEEMQEITGG